MNTTKTLTTLLIVCTLALLGLGGWTWQLTKAHAAQLADLADTHTREIEAKNRAHEDSLASLDDTHQRALKAINDAHEKKIDGLLKDQTNKMASAFREFESIFDGNKKTINYIDALEARVKAGQGVSKTEVEKLVVIATGLGYLQKEYQKPFAEFKQLETYLSQQANTNTTKPKSGFGFFKRMFNSDFRKAEQDFYRSEGAREAFSAAQSKFSTVYAAAQSQMSAVSIDAEGYTKKLYALIEDKQQANTEDLSNFFDQARKALKTHQEVLDFSPNQLPEAAPRP